MVQQYLMAEPARQRFLRHEQGVRPPWRYTLILAAILAVFFGGIAALWLVRTDLYFATMHLLGVDAFSKPFLDLSGVLAMGECHRLGIDPTLPSPCDPLRRILPYGPAVLYEPFATPDVMGLGLIQSLLFLAAVSLVLRPRTRIELAVATFASISCGVLYALERGNFDLVEFYLVAAGVFVSMQGYFGRLGSYFLFFAGGAAKFYPFALLVTIARERLAVAIGLATLSLALIAVYLFAYHDVLSKLSAALPPFEYNIANFGAICLPFGLADWLGLPFFVGYFFMALLVLSAGFAAWRFARHLHAQCSMADFDTVNFRLLVAGAIVLVGCFFMGPSNSYRSIFLLLLLPGLFDMARKPRLRRWAAGAIGAVLFCVWSEFFRQWGEAGIDWLMDSVAPNRGDALWGATPSIAYFISRELLWWALIAVMLAVIELFIFQARAMRDCGRVLGINYVSADS